MEEPRPDARSFRSARRGPAEGDARDACSARGTIPLDRRRDHDDRPSDRPMEATMSLIKVKELAYGRLRAPDLDAMEEFLTHFGMKRSARTPNALYMRGTDPGHHLHVTEKGDPAFVGFAYLAASEDDLRRVAKAPGASDVESIDEPGGGKRVRLREPNGYQIEVVHGIEALA